MSEVLKFLSLNQIFFPVDDEEGDGDSEMNYYEKLEPPVESETADMATNTSPQQEPVEQKIHELLSEYTNQTQDQWKNFKICGTYNILSVQGFLLKL